MQSIMPYKRCAIVIFTLKLIKDYRSVEKMSLRMCFHAFSHNRGDVQKISLPIGYRAEIKDALWHRCKSRCSGYAGGYCSNWYGNQKSKMKFELLYILVSWIIFLYKLIKKYPVIGDRIFFSCYFSQPKSFRQASTFSSKVPKSIPCAFSF